MKITTNDIKYLVKETIKNLYENNGHLDKKLMDLSLAIANTVRQNLNKNTNFSLNLPLDFIKKYYPYKNPSSLKITVGKDICYDAAQYKNENNKKEILLNYNYIIQRTQFGLASIISHELTHFVNDNEIITTNEIYTVDDDDIYNIVYFLRSTECNARCTEFASFLYYYTKNKIFPLSFYENITHINEIENLINKFNNNTDKQYQLKQSNGKTLEWYMKKFRKYVSKIKKNLF